MSNAPASTRAAVRQARHRLEDYPKGARKLILTAERLFGQHGIDNVSLRQIVSAAGQGNNYAVQHHFGSKEGLIDAIFNFRMAELDIARGEALKSLKTRKTLTMGDVISAILMPITQALNEKDRHLYVDFTMQVLHRNKLGRGSSLKDDIPVYETAAPNLVELNALLRSFLPDMPLDIFNIRYRLSAEMFISGLNELRRLNLVGRNPYGGEAQFWEDILGLTLAIFTAPIPSPPSD